MTLPVPAYERLPEAPKAASDLIEVAIQVLHPTQMCVGMAEIQHRIADFQNEDPKERRRYLKTRPIPLVRSSTGELWMVDRHHRLRGLLAVDPAATGWGYIALDLQFSNRSAVLQSLQQRGWLYLYDGRGLGPLEPEELPETLLGCQDDPYRSLVWKLKREGVIERAPLIPFHEFRWAAWLRRKALPPFNSQQLEPALPAARAYARSAAASRMPGWTGRGQ